MHLQTLHTEMGDNHLCIPNTIHLETLQLDEDVLEELDTPMVRKTYPDLPRSADWSDHRTFVRARLEYMRGLDNAVVGFRKKR